MRGIVCGVVLGATALALVGTAAHGIAPAPRAPKPGQPGFAVPPTAAQAVEGCRITFTVTAPTDAEVAVLDKAGRVVRHLAAGVLGGPNPPPEPLTPGLAQALRWDGKDDLGKPAGSGPFTMRVERTFAGEATCEVE